MQHFRERGDTNDVESDVENRPQAEKIKADHLGRTSRRSGRPASTPDQKVCACRHALRGRSLFRKASIKAHGDSKKSCGTSWRHPLTTEPLWGLMRSKSISREHTARDWKLHIKVLIIFFFFFKSVCSFFSFIFGLAVGKMSYSDQFHSWTWSTSFKPPGGSSALTNWDRSWPTNVNRTSGKPGGSTLVCIKRCLTSHGKCCSKIWKKKIIIILLFTQPITGFQVEINTMTYSAFYKKPWIV